jgi:hypothetical protein
MREYEDIFTIYSPGEAGGCDARRTIQATRYFLSTEANSFNADRKIDVSGAARVSDGAGHGKIYTARRGHSPRKGASASI